MNDRNRRAPVTLTRDQPVAQAVVGSRRAGAALEQDAEDCIDGLSLTQAVKRTGVHVRAIISGGDAGHCRIFASIDHDTNR